MKTVLFRQGEAVQGDVDDIERWICSMTRVEIGNDLGLLLKTTHVHDFAYAVDDDDSLLLRYNDDIYRVESIHFTDRVAKVCGGHASSDDSQLHDTSLSDSQESMQGVGSSVDEWTLFGNGEDPDDIVDELFDKSMPEAVRIEQLALQVGRTKFAKVVAENSLLARPDAENAFTKFLKSGYTLTGDDWDTLLAWSHTHTAQRSIVEHLFIFSMTSLCAEKSDQVINTVLDIQSRHPQTLAAHPQMIDKLVRAPWKGERNHARLVVCALQAADAGMDLLWKSMVASARITHSLLSNFKFITGVVYNINCKQGLRFFDCITPGAQILSPLMHFLFQCTEECLVDRAVVLSNIWQMMDRPNVMLSESSDSTWLPIVQNVLLGVTDPSKTANLVLSHMFDVGVYRTKHALSLPLALACYSTLQQMHDDTKRMQRTTALHMVAYIGIVAEAKQHVQLQQSFKSLSPELRKAALPTQLLHQGKLKPKPQGTFNLFGDPFLPVSAQTFIGGNVLRLSDSESSDEDEDAIDREMVELNALQASRKWFSLVEKATPRWYAQHEYDSEAMFPKMYRDTIHSRLFGPTVDVNAVVDALHRALQAQRVGVAICLYWKYRTVGDMERALDARLQRSKVPIAFIQFLDHLPEQAPRVVVPSQYQHIAESYALLYSLAREDELLQVMDEPLLQEDYTPHTEPVSSDDTLRSMVGQQCEKDPRWIPIGAHLHEERHKSIPKQVCTRILAKNAQDIPLAPIQQDISVDQLQTHVRDKLKPFLSYAEKHSGNHAVQIMLKHAIQADLGVSQAEDATAMTQRMLAEQDGLIAWEDRNLVADVAKIKQFIDDANQKIISVQKQMARNPTLSINLSIAQQTLRALSTSLQGRITSGTLTKEFLEEKLVPTLHSFARNCQQMGVDINSSVLGNKRASVRERVDETAMERLNQQIKAMNVEQRPALSRGIQDLQNEYLEQSERSHRLQKNLEQCDPTTQQLLEQIIAIDDLLRNDTTAQLQKLIEKPDQHGLIVLQARYLKITQQWERLMQLLAFHWNVHPLWSNEVSLWLQSDDLLAWQRSFLKQLLQAHG